LTTKSLRNKSKTRYQETMDADAQKMYDIPQKCKNSGSYYVTNIK